MPPEYTNRRKCLTKKPVDMKKCLIFFAVLWLFGACSYDDNELWDKVGDLDRRLSTVEEQLNRLNDQISQLRTLAEALEGAKFIVSYTETDNGCTITFSDGETIEISNGKDGVTSDDIPIIGIRNDQGVWYWTVTLNGRTDYLTDDSGNRIPVTGNDGEPGAPGQPGDAGVTPLMGVDAEGFWTVDYGSGPVRITDPEGKPIPVTGSGTDSLFASVKVEGNCVVFTLRNGTVFTVPLRLDVDILLPEGEQYTVPAGTGRDIPFIVSGIGGKMTVSAIADGLWKAETAATADPQTGKWNGTLTVTAPDSGNGKVILLVSDECGGVWMKEVSVECGAAPSTDLGAAGDANCFVVSEPGLYSFAARKGDGSPVEGIAKAAWIWAAAADWNYPEFTGQPSADYMIDPASVSYADGRITFSTASAFRSGNVLIGASDGSGTVLWSWHIWFTEVPQGYAADNAGTVFMDRNLGATSNRPGMLENLGLLYQWGRKEPFIGSDATTASEETAGAFVTATAASVLNRTVFGDISWGTVLPDARLTYDEAAALPTKLVSNANQSPSYGVADWTAASNPCPAGWTVPSQLQVWGHFGFTGYSQIHACVFDEQNKGWVPDGYENEWWAASGDRDAGLGGRIRDVGEYGYFWTGTQGSSSNMSPYVRMNKSEARSLQASKGWAYAVRCVRR